MIQDILVYPLAVPPVQATGYSLAIVRTMIGAAEYLRRGQTHLPLALVFGRPLLPESTSAGGCSCPPFPIPCWP